MTARGYSLVEVVMAAAIVAIGVAAGAAMMNTLVVQEELNASSVRAANLQEQATVLYRLGVTNPQDLYNILPEPCSAVATPAANAFSLTFGTPSLVTNAVDGPSGGSISYQVVSCTVVHGNRVAGSSQVTYLTNTVSLVRPTIRIEP